MQTKGILFTILMALLFFTHTQGALSQETVVRGGAVPAGQEEPEIQWVWGDVVSMDAPNKTLAVRYLDYETDQEKEMIVGVDEQTAYENIKSIEEVKLRDIVSVDYVTAADGKNIARNISVEKPDNPQGMQEEGVVVPEPNPTLDSQEESVPVQE